MRPATLQPALSSLSTLRSDISEQGFEIEVDGKTQLLEVDHVIICAGQEPERSLYQGLLDAEQRVHLIGGAHVASELDAKRAIREAADLAMVI